MEIESDLNIQSRYIGKNNRIIPRVEAWIIRDLSNYKTKKVKKFEINILNLECINEEDYIMLVEFVNLFKIQIQFPKNYPYEPPIITFISGKFYNTLFDMENNIKLDCLIEGKWFPIYDLNYILDSIEMKISENIKYIPIKIIRKRNYFEYQEMNGINVFINDNYCQKKLKLVN